MIGICLPRPAKKVAQNLLFFVRGGYVDPRNQQLRSAGQWGGCWSSRAYSDAYNAYYLRFYDDSVNPSYGYNGSRYFGFPLRCLIPTT